MSHAVIVVSRLDQVGTEPVCVVPGSVLTGRTRASVWLAPGGSNDWWATEATRLADGRVVALIAGAPWSPFPETVGVLTRPDQRFRSVPPDLMALLSEYGRSPEDFEAGELRHLVSLVRESGTEVLRMERLRLIRQALRPR